MCLKRELNNQYDVANFSKKYVDILKLTLTKMKIRIIVNFLNNLTAIMVFENIHVLPF